MTVFKNFFVFIQPLHSKQDKSQDQLFTRRVKQVLFQTFSYSRLVSLPKLKNLVYPTV